METDKNPDLVVESGCQTIESTAAAMLLDVFHVVEKVELWNGK
jgi:hypothetical protein